MRWSYNSASGTLADYSTFLRMCRWSSCQVGSTRGTPRASLVPFGRGAQLRRLLGYGLRTELTGSSSGTASTSTTRCGCKGHREQSACPVIVVPTPLAELPGCSSVVDLLPRMYGRCRAEASRELVDPGSPPEVVRGRARVGGSGSGALTCRLVRARCRGRRRGRSHCSGQDCVRRAADDRRQGRVRGRSAGAFQPPERSACSTMHRGADRSRSAVDRLSGTTFRASPSLLGVAGTRPPATRAVLRAGATTPGAFAFPGPPGFAVADLTPANTGSSPHGDEAMRRSNPSTCQSRS